MNLHRDILGQCKRELLGVAVFSFFQNLLLLALPLYLLQVYGRVLPSRSIETLIYLTLATLIAFAVLGLLISVRARLLARLGQKVNTLLSDRIFEAEIARAARPGRRSESRGLRDLSVLSGFLGSNDMAVLADAPWTPIFLVAIFLLHPLLGIIATVGAALLLTLALVNAISTRRLLAETGARASAAHAEVEAGLRNAEVVEAMGMRAALLGRWESQNDRLLADQQRAADRTATVRGLFKTLRLGLQVVVLAAGAYLVVGHALVPGAMIVSILLLSRALSPVEAAIGTWKNLVKAREAGRRIARLLDEAPSGPAPMRLPAPKGALTVEGVHFTPERGARPILKNVSFELAAGEFLGVVGPSAAGKSTLARMLVGVWRPTRGHVRLDGADVADWDSAELGRHVGYLPQNVALFDGTVRENIARLDQGDPTMIVEAARRAGIHEMILALPDGYETRIGAGGITLSGGQCQRIALARALYGSPRLIVLDEPNANLDAEGVAALRAALAAAKADGATIVVVAHRPSVLADAEKILMLRGGRVERFGSREEVMARIAPRAARVVDLDAVRQRV